MINRSREIIKYLKHCIVWNSEWRINNNFNGLQAFGCLLKLKNRDGNLIYLYGYIFNRTHYDLRIMVITI